MDSTYQQPPGDLDPNNNLQQDTSISQTIPDDATQNQHDQELQQVLESISFGKLFAYKKLQFQAFSAAISHQEQVRFVKSYLSDVNNTFHSKFPSSKTKIIAYRVNQPDHLQQSQQLAEGFDDDGEAGAGEKLLGVLQKMEIENILVIVCIWTTGAQIGGQSIQVKGGELYKIVIERAKELLNTIHEQIVQQEVTTQKQMEEERMKELMGKKKALGTKVYSMGAAANDQVKGVTGLKGASVIKKDLRIRNQSPITNMDQLHINSNENTDEEEEIQRQNGQSQIPDEIEQQIIQSFPDTLSVQDYQDASKEVEESLRNITKSALMELKQQSKPHPLVEKSLQIVTALRGFKNFQWSIAKEILAKPQFKVELLQTKPRTLRAKDVLRANQILNQKTNVTLTPQNVHIHSECAALLLVWAANIIKMYACTKKLGESVVNKDENMIQHPVNLDEIQRISARTKILVKKDIQQKRTEGINIPQAVKDVSHTVSQHPQQPQQDITDQNQLSRQQQLQMNQKSGTIGHFLQNKQMVFSVEGNQLAPEKKIGTQEPLSLVDISVIKKGGFNSVTNKSKQAQKQEEIILKQEEERMLEDKNNKNAARSNLLQRKKQMQTQQQQQQPVANNSGGGANHQQQNNSQSQPNKSKQIYNDDLNGVSGSIQNEHNMNDDDLFHSTQDNRNQQTDDNPAKLKLYEVRELNDDVDEIIGKLKGVDYGIQDLEVLIELAKTLKHKRLTLFPDTSNVLMSENFGVYNNNATSDTENK